MRAADSLPDPAQVLLDRGPVTGQSGTGRTGARWAALDRVRWLGRSGASRGVRTGPAAARSSWRNDDPGWVGNDRIEQLDLDPDDRVEPDGFSGADETDRTVEAVVVGDGQP